MFTFLLPDTAPYRYWKLNTTATLGGGSAPVNYVDIRYIVGATAFPTVNMTTDSAPSPLVASASSTNGSFSLGPFEAFDGDAGTYWISNSTPPAWIAIDLGSTGLIRPTGIRITPRASRSPTEFQVLASNTGAFAGEERTIYSVTGLTTGWTDEVARTITF